MTRPEDAVHEFDALVEPVQRARRLAELLDGLRGP